MASKSRKEQIRELIELEPDDPELHYALAMESVSEGDDAAAVSAFVGLRQRAPDYVPGYVQAGRALIRLGRDDEASEVLKAGIATATKKGDAHAAGEMVSFWPRSRHRAKRSCLEGRCPLN